MNYSISITTACYNSEMFIERTYESIVAQNYQNLEWVVVNDASADKTLEIITAISKRAPFPVRIINFEKNQGPIFTNTTAVQNATGDFTIFLDHDDELMPGAIIKLLEIWDTFKRENPSEELYAVWGRCIDENNNMLGSVIPGLPMICSNGYFFHVLKCRAECFCMLQTGVLQKYYNFSAKETGGTNGLIWNRIGQVYKAVFTNEIFRRYHTNVPGSMMTQRKIKNPGVMANQEAEYLNTNIAFFENDLVFFAKKILFYLYYSYLSGVSITSSIKNLHYSRLKIVAFTLVPVLPLLLMKYRFFK